MIRLFELGLVARNDVIGELTSLNQLTILTIEPLDSDKVAVVLVVMGDKLGDDLKSLGGVHPEVGSRPIQCFIPVAIGVVVRTIFVAPAFITTATVPALVGFCASLYPDIGAGVRGKCGSHGVGLPDVHLIGAGAGTIGIGPSPNVLDVFRALSIAVVDTVGAADIGAASVQGHFDKVKCAVQATWQLGHVHGEGELAIAQIKPLVIFAVWIHEVDT